MARRRVKSQQEEGQMFTQIGSWSYGKSGPLAAMAVVGLHGIVAAIILALVLAAVVGLVLYLVPPTRPFAGAAAAIVFLIVILLSLV